MNILLGIFAGVALAFSPEIVMIMLVSHIDDRAESWFRAFILMGLFSFLLVVAASDYRSAGPAFALLLAGRLVRRRLKRKSHGDFYIDVQVTTELALAMAEIEKESGHLQGGVADRANTTLGKSA